MVLVPKRIATTLFAVLILYTLHTPLCASGRKDSDSAKFATSEELSKQNNPAAGEQQAAPSATQSDEAPNIQSEQQPNAQPSQQTVPPVHLSALISLEIPLCSATRTPEIMVTGHEVHAYTGFTLCYREDYEVAEWVSYELTKSELNAVVGRTDDFRADTKITTGSATPQDYTKSGYDRGHLAPAADMEWSEKAVRDSFLMSNMTPQLPQFNRGMWKELESEVRTWADRFENIYVVTGPVLEKSPAAYKRIGSDEVCVPDYFYKVLLSQLKDEKQTIIAIAFILPNAACSGTIADYAVPVDEVEQRTGIDFFSLLPDDIEAPLEAKVVTDAWFCSDVSNGTK